MERGDAGERLQGSGDEGELTAQTLQATVTDQIAEYYRRAPIVLPSDPQWRFFRVQKESGHFQQVKDNVRDIETLRRHLMRLRPFHAWYSAGRWLNAQNVSSNDSEWSNSVLINSDVIIEADYEVLEEARQNALKTWDWVESAGYRVVNCTYSGRRGFQLATDMRITVNDGNPKTREEQDRKQRETIAERLVAEEIQFDRVVLENPRNIFRLPYSLNMKTGRACILISRRELDDPAIVERSERAEIVVPKPRDEGISPPAIRIAGAANRPEGPPASQFYLASVVGAINRQIVSLRYSNLDEMDLLRLQRDFNLADWFLVKGQYLWAVNLKTCDQRRFFKILNMSHADQAYASACKRLGYGFFERKVTPYGVIAAEMTMPGQYSRPHKEILASLGFQVRNYRLEIGNMELVERTWNRK